MIPKTIAEIEARIREANSLSDSRRAELLALVDSLKHEATELARTNVDQARNVVEHARLYTEEAIREGSSSGAHEPALERLTDSVSEFEESHPKLVEVVNRIALMLSNSGI